MFGWLDTDAEQQRRVLELVDQFRDSEAVDELGVGSIRDALADLMFPATSTIHTRLRYMLFIPWLLQEAAAKRQSAEEAWRAYENSEFRLIDALLKGGETTDVIGSAAKRNLKRKPHSIYWGAMGRLGIRDNDSTPQSYLQRVMQNRAIVRRAPKSEDAESFDRAMRLGLDLHLPEPPKDLLNQTTFSLRRVDAEYLADRITGAAAGSVLKWLVSNRPNNQPAFAWELENLDQAPGNLREIINHARRFSIAIHGARVVYNLYLARRRGDGELMAHYNELLEEWQLELVESGALKNWNRREWWSLFENEYRIPQPTRNFVNTWLDLLDAGNRPAESQLIEDLIVSREWRLKGNRARLVNQNALDRWSGATGLGRLSYRWEIARSHLQDIYSGLESP